MSLLHHLPSCNMGFCRTELFIFRTILFDLAMIRGYMDTFTWTNVDTTETLAQTNFLTRLVGHFNFFPGKCFRTNLETSQIMISENFSQFKKFSLILTKSEFAFYKTSQGRLACSCATRASKAITVFTLDDALSSRSRCNNQHWLVPSNGTLSHESGTIFHDPSITPILSQNASNHHNTSTVCLQ